MGIEANTGPSDQTIEKLDKTWPLGTDLRSFWDDHARFIKSVLKNTFPGVGGNGFNTPIIATEAELNQLSGVLLSSKLATPKIDASQGTDIASATTINLETATGQYVNVTGTTTITGITLNQGHMRIVKFTGVLTLTNGANLVLPGAANITTAVGDIAIFVGEASGIVRCISYNLANGRATVVDNQFVTCANGSITKANTDASGGTTVITGLSFTPKQIRFSSSQDVAGTMSSHGSYSTAANTNKCIVANGAGGSSGPQNHALYTAQGAAINYADVTAVVSGGFTLTWTKSGSPTGNTFVVWEAIG